MLHNFVVGDHTIHFRLTFENKCWKQRSVNSPMRSMLCIVIACLPLVVNVTVITITRNSPRKVLMWFLTFTIWSECRYKRQLALNSIDYRWDLFVPCVVNTKLHASWLLYLNQLGTLTLENNPICINIHI